MANRRWSGHGHQSTHAYPADKLAPRSIKVARAGDYLGWEDLKLSRAAQATRRQVKRAHHKKARQWSGWRDEA